MLFGACPPPLPNSQPFMLFEMLWKLAKLFHARFFCISYFEIRKIYPNKWDKRHTTTSKGLEFLKCQKMLANYHKKFLLYFFLGYYEVNQNFKFFVEVMFYFWKIKQCQKSFAPNYFNFFFVLFNFVNKSPHKASSHDTFSK